MDDDLAEQIRPLLVHRPGPEQREVLARLVALHLQGTIAPNLPLATRRKQEQRMWRLEARVWELVNEKAAGYEPKAR